MDFNLNDYLDCVPERMTVANVQTIAAVESTQTPFALNIDGVGSFYPETLDEAVALVVFHKESRMDIGYMQVSSSNAKAYGVDALQLLHPCDNIRIGSEIYLSFFDRIYKKTKNADDATIKALSAYNTGDFVKGITNGYVFKYIDQ